MRPTLRRVPGPAAAAVSLGSRARPCTRSWERRNRHSVSLMHCRDRYGRQQRTLPWASASVGQWGSSPPAPGCSLARGAGCPGWVRGAGQQAGVPGDVGAFHHALCGCCTACSGKHCGEERQCRRPQMNRQHPEVRFPQPLGPSSTGLGPTGRGGSRLGRGDGSVRGSQITPSLQHEGAGPPAACWAPHLLWMMGVMLPDPGMLPWLL